MYLRSKLQQRALSNLDMISQKKYKNMRVTRGHVISELLENYSKYIADSDVLHKAIIEADLKEGLGTAVNFCITSEANKKMLELKVLLDNETGRSLFPAQILDVLLICAISTEEEKVDVVKEVSNEVLAKKLFDYAYALLVEEPISLKVANAKNDMVEVLIKHHIL